MQQEWRLDKPLKKKNLLALPLLCRKSRALAMSCTTTLASCSLKWRLLWICAKIDPDVTRDKTTSSPLQKKKGEKANAFHHTGTKHQLHSRGCKDALQGVLVNKQGNWIQTSCCWCSCCSLTSPELLKHQVEFVFLFKELDQLQDVTTKRIKKTNKWGGNNL